MLARISEVSDCWHLKMLSLKQIFQKLPIAFSQLKADNTPENLLNKT